MSHLVKCTDAHTIVKHYLPFVVHGGIFVPTHQAHFLGEMVSLLLIFADAPERYSIEGKVIWITPAGAQGKRPQGIGVQFSAQDVLLQKRLEALIAGLSA